MDALFAKCMTLAATERFGKYVVTNGTTKVFGRVGLQGGVAWGRVDGTLLCTIEKKDVLLSVGYSVF
eukprot:768178-Rhodomonas_salina.1